MNVPNNEEMSFYMLQGKYDYPVFLEHYHDVSSSLMTVSLRELMQSEIIHYYKIDAVPNKQRIADIKNCQK